LHGDAAIHIAAWADDNPELLETIFLAGASLNAKNKNGSTPLQHTACLSHPRNGGYLLRMGADIECRDKGNDSPLFEAVRYSDTAMVEVLLRHGAKVDYANNYGQAVLHLAANWANVRTVEVLTEARLEGLGTESRDCKGRTTWEVFEARAARPDEFYGAFGKLIDG
jgi:ankyrin repeat protein